MIEHSTRIFFVWLNNVGMFNHICNSLWYLNDVFIVPLPPYGQKTNHLSSIIDDSMIEHSTRIFFVWLNNVGMFNHICNSLWYLNDVFRNIKEVFGDKVGAIA